MRGVCRRVNGLVHNGANFIGRFVFREVGRYHDTHVKLFSYLYIRNIICNWCAHTRTHTHTLIIDERVAAAKGFLSKVFFFFVYLRTRSSTYIRYYCTHCSACIIMMILMRMVLFFVSYRSTNKRLVAIIDVHKGRRYTFWYLWNNIKRVMCVHGFTYNTV